MRFLRLDHTRCSRERHLPNQIKVLETFGPVKNVGEAHVSKTRTRSREGSLLRTSVGHVFTGPSRIGKSRTRFRGGGEYKNERSGHF